MQNLYEMTVNMQRGEQKYMVTLTKNVCDETMIDLLPGIRPRALRLRWQSNRGRAQALPLPSGMMPNPVLCFFDQVRWLSGARAVIAHVFTGANANFGVAPTLD